MPTTKTKPLAILGAAEFAQRLGMTTNVFSVRRGRGQLPPPDAILSCGPIWRESTVARWEATRRSVDTTNV